MCLPRGTDAQARSRMTSSLATVGRPIRSLAAAILIALPGCGVSPSVNILGSFFPAWLISIVIGVVLTVVVRQLFVAIDVASHLRPAGLVYPCLGGLLILVLLIKLLALVQVNPGLGRIQCTRKTLVGG